MRKVNGERHRQYVKPLGTLLLVNLTLSKRGDYVIRAALALARAYPSGGYRKIREVVAEMDVPSTFASQILADLGVRRLRVLGTPRKLVGLAGFGLEVTGYEDAAQGS